MKRTTKQRKGTKTMGTPHMKPLQDERGMLTPERDYRDVPISVMAAYLGIGPSALWRRVEAGMYKAGVVRFPGSKHRLFKPRLVMGIGK